MSVKQIYFLDGKWHKINVNNSSIDLIDTPFLKSPQKAVSLEKQKKRPLQPKKTKIQRVNLLKGASPSDYVPDLLKYDDKKNESKDLVKRFQFYKKNPINSNSQVANSNKTISKSSSQVFKSKLNIDLSNNLGSRSPNLLNSPKSPQTVITSTNYATYYVKLFLTVMSSTM